MSYELVLWRSATDEDPDPDLLWPPPPPREEAVPGVVPLTFAEVREAFVDVFGSRVEIDNDRLCGPGFELTVAPVQSYLTITMASSLLDSHAGQQVHVDIALVAARLGARFFNPRADPAPVDATIRAAEADLEQLGEPVRAEDAGRDVDRAQSFARFAIWRIEGPDDGSRSIHSLFLRQASDGVSPGLFFHPSRLTRLSCEYVRLVQSVFPFE